MCTKAAHFISLLFQIYIKHKHTGTFLERTELLNLLN